MIVCNELEKLYLDRKLLQEKLSSISGLKELTELRNKLINVYKTNNIINNVELATLPVFPKQPLFLKKKITEYEFNNSLNLILKNGEISSSHYYFFENINSGPGIRRTSHGIFEIQIPKIEYNIDTLRYISHEIGHAQYEHNLTSELSVDDLLKSEIIALKSEFVFIKHSSTKSELEEYIQYQKTWWNFNITIDKIEKYEIFKSSCEGRNLRLWLIEWSSSRLGFTDILIQAAQTVFDF